MISLIPSRANHVVGQVLELTWEEIIAFFQLEPYPADKPKASLPMWSPARYRADADAPRGYVDRAHLESTSVLVYDGDVAPVPDVDGLRAALRGRRFVAASSSSATASSPKWRLCLEVDRPILPDEYPRVWSAVAATLSFAVGQEAKNPDRAWYAPRRGADGTYIVLAGDGTPINVEEVLASTPLPGSDPTPGALALGALPKAHRARAAAVGALAAAWPDKGRHAAQHALAGALCREGWPEAEATEFLCDVARGTGNEDRPKREATVRRAYARHAAGEALTGWTTLEAHVGAGVVSSVRGLVAPDPNGAAGFAAMVAEMQSAPKGTAADVAGQPIEAASGPRRFKTVPATELAQALPPRTYFFRHWGIARGRPTLLAGYGGIGKTFIVQALALHAAAGTGEVFGRPVASGAVVHIDYEMTIEPVQDRYQRLAHGYGLDLASAKLEVSSMPSVYLSDADAENLLVDVCTGKTLAVIDNLLAACATANLKENESGIRRYLDVLTRVTARTACVFIVLVHERKPSKDESSGGLHRVRGSSAITDAAGSVISVSPAEGDGIVSVKQTKSSLRKPGTELLLKIEDVGLPESPEDEDPPGLRVVPVKGHPAAERRERLQEAILELLSKGPQETKRSIEDALGGKRGPIGTEIDALAVRRQIVSIKGVGWVLDTERARQARVLDAVRSFTLYTPGKVARAAHVDTGFVETLMLQRVLSKDGTGRFWVNDGVAL